MADAKAAFIPGPIKKLMGELQEATGYEPTAMPLYAGRWRITLASDRVRMTYDFKVVRRKKLQRSSTTLSVDGQPREDARNMKHLAAIFRDPDNAKPPEPSPMPPPLLADEAPEEIRKLFEKIQSIVGDKFDVGLGKTEQRWTLGLDFEGAALRLHFNTDADHSHGATLNAVELFIDGDDYSAELARSMKANPGRALVQAVMAVTHGTYPTSRSAAPDPTRSDSPAGKGFGSVQVRRSTVIRN